MSFTKFIGWLTFLAGISIIIFTLYFSFNVLTGKVGLPEFFQSQTVQTPISQQEMFPGQEQIGNLISEQLKGLLPEGVVPKILNLLVWSILAGILIFGGAQIANLGIKLLNIKEEPKNQ
jgi:hypothetical protein